MKSKETASNHVTPIPTAETALLSLKVGKPFKPEGREPVAEDCVEYDDLITGHIVSTSEINKIFSNDDPYSKEVDPGSVASRAYGKYCSLAEKEDPESASSKAELSRIFKEITNLEILDVVKFENEVRELHGKPKIKII